MDEFSDELSLEQREQIDRVADQFEAEFRVDRRPKIGGFRLLAPELRRTLHVDVSILVLP